MPPQTLTSASPALGPFVAIQTILDAPSALSDTSDPGFDETVSVENTRAVSACRAQVPVNAMAALRSSSNRALTSLSMIDQHLHEALNGSPVIIGAVREHSTEPGDTKNAKASCE